MLKCPQISAPYLPMPPQTPRFLQPMCCSVADGKAASPAGLRSSPGPVTARAGRPLGSDLHLL